VGEPHYWRFNLARHPIRLRVSTVGLWFFVALGAVAFLWTDLALLVLEAQRTYQVYRRRQSLRQVAARQQATIEQIRRQIRDADTPVFRQECAFLGQQLQARNFSWSDLLRHLEEVLPPSVRMQSITPHPREASAGPSTPSLGGIPVSLTVEARRLQDFNEMFRRMYQSGLFADLRVRREERDTPTQTIRFEMTVLYRVRPEVLSALAEEARP
jgi:Tfp pilus assembly protein PilN